MKKYIYTLALLFVTSQYAITIVKDKASILQALVSSHNGAFGKDNLYKEQFTSEQLNTWNSAISEMKKFVEARSSSGLGIKDKDLTNALSAIEKANIDLVNTIKITRGSLQSPEAVKQNIAALEKIKQAMLLVQKNLNNATFILNKEDKMTAKELLINAAMFIETTASKAIKDTAKI